MKNKIIRILAGSLILFSILLFPPGNKPLSAQSNWWDKFGEPQYGGTMTFCVSGLMAVNFDVYNFIGSDNNFYYESMFEPDWTLDRNIYGMATNFVPDQYWKGQLAESWEMPDGKTIVVHIHEDIHWQNKPPVNGREFTAYDVQKHYDRLLGTGEGYTWKAPMYMGMAANIERVTARDKYTVVYKFKKASALSFQTIADRISLNVIEAPEWVALGGKPVPPEPPKGGPAPEGGGGPPPMPDFGHGPLQDWTKVVGTGPWMLEKYVGGTSFLYTKNPDYWGRDPRYPQNKLPYADKLSMIVIPDMSTRVAAIRTGKIDLLGNGPGGNIDWKQANTISKRDPKLLMGKYPAGANGIGIRADKAPFTDIRVRKALNMAIDRKTVAKSVYGGTSDGNPAGMITQAYKGFAFDYKDWPQSLKDEYAFNPEGAKKLLAEAGFPNGFKTNVVTATTDPVFMEIIQVCKSYFKNIGVDMEIRAMESIAKEQFTRAGKHDQLSAQAGAQNFPPFRSIDQYYSKSADAVYFGLSEKPDAVYDKLHDDFINAADPAKAAEIFRQADRRVIEQHWIVTPCETYSYYIWQPYLKGYSGESVFWGQGVMWSRLWVDKKLKK